MRRGPSVLALVIGVLAIALLGGALALGIGAAAGWIGKSTKTVVVNARTSPAQNTALPASVTSKARPLPGNGFDPAFLLRQPAAKKRAWSDLLTLTERLDRPHRPA